MNVDKERVILNRDNEFALFLLSKGQPLADFGTITRVTIEIDGHLIDSDVVGSSVIWWSESEEWRPGETRPVVKFKLGTLDDGAGGLLLSPGVAHGCKIVTYDATNPNGLEWTRSLKVDVQL